jgi:hypothetical protein
MTISNPLIRSASVNRVTSRFTASPIVEQPPDVAEELFAEFSLI